MRIRVWRAGDGHRDWRYFCPCCDWYSVRGTHAAILRFVGLHLRIHQR